MCTYVGVFVLIASALVAAQTPGAPTAFAAASVRPNTSGAGNVGFQIFPGGQFRATNATVRQLVQASYDFAFERFQIVGGPAWIDVDRFDVQATPAPAPADRIATQEEIAVRIQALMAERFQLVVRRETREMQRFELVVARPAAGLKPSAGTCAPPGSERAAGDARPRCGFTYPPDSGELQRMVAAGVRLADLTRRLQGLVQAIVVDKTGLTGSYDFRLDYLPRDLQRQLDAGAGVTIFTALPEQIGLRLEPTRGPVEVVVIDRVERPTEQ